jgi:hypothetical protein
MDPGRELAEAIAAIKAAHFDAEGNACDYAALAASSQRGRLAARLGDLQGIDLKRLRIPAQTAFWINIFNAAVLRDAMELAFAESVREVEAFFERPRISVGGLAYSLDDVQHGLLRGNLAKHGRLRAPMSRDDPRLAFMPLAFDERIHFALFSAARSSPALQAFEAGALEGQLDAAAGAYVRRMVRIEQDGAVVVLPRQFRWYASDFGDAHGIIEFVAAWLEEDAVAAIDRRRGRVKLRYADFDWTLNRKAP